MTVLFCIHVLRLHPLEQALLPCVLPWCALCLHQHFLKLRFSQTLVESDPRKKGIEHSDLVIILSKTPHYVKLATGVLIVQFRQVLEIGLSQLDRRLAAELEVICEVSERDQAILWRLEPSDLRCPGQWSGTGRETLPLRFVHPLW